jgi:hypothetical protein
MWLTLHYSSHSFPWHQYQLSCRQFTAAVISDQSHWLDLRQATSTNINQHEPTESYWHLSTSYWSGTESLRGSCSSHPEMGRGEGDEGRPWGTNLGWTFGNSWTYYDLLHHFYICSVCSILFIVSGGLMDSLNFQPQAWSLMFKHFGSGDGRILALGSGQCARQFLTVKLL